MAIPWSRCGNYEPHDPHPQPGVGQLDCPGWTAEQQAVRHLITSVHEYVRERYPLSGPPFRRELPAGLRLEMHPSVRRLLMRDADLWLGVWSVPDTSGWLPVPAKFTTDVPEGSWRLVIVTEEVLLDEKTARQETL